MFFPHTTLVKITKENIFFQQAQASSYKYITIHIENVSDGGILYFLQHFLFILTLYIVALWI